VFDGKVDYAVDKFKAEHPIKESTIHIAGFDKYIEAKEWRDSR
jgi:hypothetical protein